MNQKQKSGVRSQESGGRPGSLIPQLKVERSALSVERSGVSAPVLARTPGLVRVITNGKTIQITPGLSVQPAPLAAVPAFGVVEWTRLADGRFEPKLLVHSEWFKLTRDPSKQLGLPVSRDTLLRLGRAGFIQLRRFTPFEIQVNLQSLIEHLENCEEDDFWTPERIEQYREAL